MKPSLEEESKRPQLLVFWILWFAILSGLVMIQLLIGGGIPSGSNLREPPLLPLIIASILTVLSIAIRFILIPKATELVKLLPLMIIGLALAEGVGFMGLFLLTKDFPETQLIIFATSVICIILYAPVYAKALMDREDLDKD